MSLKIEIIDDFLSVEDLKTLQSLDLGVTRNKEMNVYVKKIDEYNKVSGTGMGDGTAIEFHQIYYLKILNLLKKLNPKKAELYEYRIFVNYPKLFSYGKL